MSAGRNKSGSTGMRILWIPGKKKQPKGTYEPTKKNNLSPHHQQKKLEPWSLGGTKGQGELLKSDIPGADMASPSVLNCLPSTVGISAACSADSKPEEGAVGGKIVQENDLIHEHSNGGGGAMHIKTDPESMGPPQNTSPQPMSPRLGPLANIDEDEHENDFEDPRDDYCGASSNTATLLLKDRRMNKRLLPSTDDKDIEGYADSLDDEKSEEKCKLDRPDGVPHMRGLNRKLTIERNYRDQAEGKDKVKDKDKQKGKTGMNEKVVDCLYVGLTCCDCSIQ